LPTPRFERESLSNGTLTCRFKKATPISIAVQNITAPACGIAPVPPDTDRDSLAAPALGSRAPPKARAEDARHD